MNADQRREHIKRLVDAAPPLSEATKARLRRLLAPAQDQHRRGGDAR